MTQEEIIQAISDDKMMPFIQPEQLAQIVEFVIKNYQPSLPSDLDEAAFSYENNLWESGFKECGYSPQEVSDAFKAGAEWMARQGETFDGIVREDGFVDFDDYGSSMMIPSKTSCFNNGEEVIVQIRKKQ